MENYGCKIVATFLVQLIILISCSNESNDGFKEQFTDQTITIDENPTQGTIIGKVKENLQGNYVFTIESQNPGGAFEINAATGELIVSDELLFNYEIYPELAATIAVSNVEGSTAVNFNVVLNDIDDIVFFLETSREAYLGAANGDWVVVTEEEYNLLTNRITGVVKSGTSDVQYELEGTTVIETQNATFANYNAQNIPENHRLFAFKYFSRTEDVEGVTIKIALADVAPAYASLPTTLPIHGQGHQYFVLKGGSEPALRELRLGMYTPEGSVIVEDPLLDSELLVSFENVQIVDQFPPIPNAIGRYQGLSTDVVQWD